MELQSLVEIAEEVKLDVVQLHGNESQDYIDGIRRLLKTPVEIWKAVRVSGEASFYGISGCKADRFLADAYADGAYGGTGRKFDWKLLQGAETARDIVLAGGLNPGNVKEAISIVRPYGVDVSSGVETNGKKDEALVGDFIRRVREMTEA